MARKGGLGRGLSAILPDVEETVAEIERAGKTPEDAVLQVPVSLIDPNRGQPRKAFDPETLASLADSIRQSGILQPLLLAREGERYTIIAGERRWRAARLAGLTEVPAIVREWDDVRRREAALVENMQREDLNPIEEAEGIRSLMEECALTQEAVAARLGKSRTAVANLLRLLSLPEDIRQAVTDGRLSAGHARVLCGIGDKALQRALFQRTLQAGLSVRQLEEAAKARPAAKRKKPLPLPSEYGELCERLRRSTGMKTVMEGTEKKGRIVLHYSSPDELQRLWDLLGEEM